MQQVSEDGHRQRDLRQREKCPTSWRGVCGHAARQRVAWWLVADYPTVDREKAYW
jgi:hypothetical protein